MATLEELSNKKDLTKQEVLDFYEADSEQDLLFGLGSRITGRKYEDLNINGGMLYAGLETIYERLVNSGYNTLQEDVMFYGVVLAGFFGIDINETYLFMTAVGPFKLAYFLDNELSDREYVQYYRKKYHEYLSRKSNIGLMTEDFLKKLMVLFEDYTENLDEDKIDELRKQAEDSLNKFKEKM